MSRHSPGRDTVRAGQRTAESVRGSRVYSVAVRAGLVAYGVVHLLIAWLAVRLAFGESDADASNTGALRELATTAAGVALLWVISLGLLTLVLWQLVALFVGYREFERRKKLLKRVSSACRSLLYGYLGIAAIRIALGPEQDEGEDAQESLSQGLLGLWGGQIIVGVIGAGVIGYGAFQVYRGLAEKFDDDLTIDLRGAGRWLAIVGHVAKGVAIGVVGALFIWAAAAFDAEKAGGMDVALQTVRQQPFGVVLLVVLAVGIGCFGVWCFFFARHAKHA